MNWLVYILGSLTALSILWLVYHLAVWSKVRVPYVLARPNRFKLIFDNLDIKDKNVYELGSATANFLFAAEKRGAAKMIGFELSPVPYLIARIKKLFKKSKAKIYFQDFFNSDLSDADIIYMFLVDRVVQRVWAKIKAQVRPGTIVVVLSDAIHDALPYKVISVPDTKTKICFYKV